MLATRPRSSPARLRIEPARHPRDPGRPGRPRSTATSSRRANRGRLGTASPAIRSSGSRRSRAGRRRAPPRRRPPGVAWNAGMFLWRRRAIRAALERVRRRTSVGSIARRAGRRPARRRLRRHPVDLDRLRGHGAGAATPGSSSWARWTSAGATSGSWTVLLEALGGVGTGRVVQPGETVEAGPDDLVVERVDGRLVLADGPAGYPRRDADRPAVGRAPGSPIVDALLERVARQEA